MGNFGGLTVLCVSNLSVSYFPKKIPIIYKTVADNYFSVNMAFLRQSDVKFSYSIIRNDRHLLKENITSLFQNYDLDGFKEYPCNWNNYPTQRST